MLPDLLERSQPDCVPIGLNVRLRYVQLPICDIHTLLSEVNNPLAFAGTSLKTKINFTVAPPSQSRLTYYGASPTTGSPTRARSSDIAIHIQAKDCRQEQQPRYERTQSWSHQRQNVHNPSNFSCPTLLSPGISASVPHTESYDFHTPYFGRDPSIRATSNGECQGKAPRPTQC